MERKNDHPNFSSTEVDNNSKDDHIQELLQSLEQQTNWDGRRLAKYDGVWCPARCLRPILSSQKHFKAKSSDIILSTMPKSGTTWLKALTFSIANRNIYTIDQTPLLTSNPHKLVPFLEFVVYWDKTNPDLESIPSPRLFSTHMPLEILPPSILHSECKIIYICRNPLDQFVSHRHFLLENRIEKEAVPLGLDDAFDLFCEGIHPFGPFWDHMIGYWNAHLKHPQKVLFLKYEDLKDDVLACIRKIAEFIGLPFSPEEENQGLIEKISKLCSFENLRSLEVNKSESNGNVKNSSYFRKGNVGDWRNYLTLEMADRINNIMESKLQDSGLKFNA